MFNRMLWLSLTHGIRNYFYSPLSLYILFCSVQFSVPERVLIALTVITYIVKTFWSSLNLYSKNISNCWRQQIAELLMVLQKPHFLPPQERI